MFSFNCRYKQRILVVLIVIFLSLVQVQCVNDRQAAILRSETFNVEGLFDANNPSPRTNREENVKKNLVFYYYKDGIKLSEDHGLEGNLADSGCLPSDKFAFIIHGWGQDCNYDWTVRLREKLTNHRGGCIVCIDYGFYKSISYIRLLRYFKPMTNALTTKMVQLKAQGFDPNRGYIFGFSFGGQLATAIGKQFGPKQFKQIDTCDMAGPGFDFRGIEDFRPAAQQVRCWHTSRNKGTRYYSCHQNVRFGNCGYSQSGETSSITSHGLCTHYYINSFEYPFYAVQPPSICMSKNPAFLLMNNYTVGYTENLQLMLPGEVFVPTDNHYPYNLQLNQVLQLNTQPRGSNQIETNVTSRPYRRRIPLLFLNTVKKLLRITEN